MTGIPRAGGLRLIRLVIVCVAVGTVINSGGGVYLYVRGQAQARQATSSLCALRKDLETRVASSLNFLRDHPAGIAGIDPKTIRDGIANQQRTISALSGIDCP